MITNKIKNTATLATILLVFFISVFSVSAATLSMSLGSYDTEIYKQETVNIPVTVTATNITGNADVTLTPKSGLSCSTCTLSYAFSGGTNEQGTVTFTLTGTQTGTYNPPFTSISAASGSTTATPLSSGNAVSVVERPTWTRTLTASPSTTESGALVTLTLTITPSDTFEGVSADLTLPAGWTLVSGSDPNSIGTITGRTTVTWVVRASSATGVITAAISSTNPTESGSSNTETVTVTVESGGDNGAPGGGNTGGSSGGASGISAGQSKSWPSIFPDKTNTFALSDTSSGISEIEFDVKEAANNAKITVLKLTSEPATIKIKIKNKVYKYINISQQNLDKKTKNIKIKFKVEKSWLMENNLTEDDVVLMHYVNDVWEELPTTKLNTDANYVHYSATTDSFSIFAISAAKPAVSGQESGAQTETGQETTGQESGAQTGTTGQQTAEPKTEDKKQSLLALILIFVLFVAFLALIIFYTRKKKQ
jgi:PGF-pre-PGF domain-containing protein